MTRDEVHVAISEPTGETCACGGRVYRTRVTGYRDQVHCVKCLRGLVPVALIEIRAQRLVEDFGE